mgnify:CR=1 FL=1
MAFELMNTQEIHEFGLQVLLQHLTEKGFEIESIDRENNCLILRGIDWPKFKLLIKLNL